MLSGEVLIADLISHEVLAIKTHIDESETWIHALHEMATKRDKALSLLERRINLEAQLLNIEDGLNHILRQKSSIGVQLANLTTAVEMEQQKVTLGEVALSDVIQEIRTLESRISELKANKTSNPEASTKIKNVRELLVYRQKDAKITRMELKSNIARLELLRSDVDKLTDKQKAIVKEEGKYRADIKNAQMKLDQFSAHVRSNVERLIQRTVLDESKEFDTEEVCRIMTDRKNQLLETIESAGSEIEKAQQNLKTLIDQQSRIAQGETFAIEALAALVCLRWADHNYDESTSSSKIIGRHRIFSDIFRWNSWRNLSLEKLSLFLMKEVAPVVRRLFQDAHDHISPELARILLPFQILVGSPPTILAVLLKWLDLQPFETLDDKRKLLSVLNKSLKSANSIRSNVSGTSPQIARLVAALARPSKGDIVYDPCFGHGEMLSAILDEAPVEDRSSLSLIGVENSQENYVLGLARLILNGGMDQKLQYNKSPGQDLSQDLIGEGFDLVVSNLRRTGQNNGLRPGVIPGQGFFSHGRSILQALSKLRPGGKLVIVTPESAMFLGGPDAEFRSALIKENKVEAVISIPEGALDHARRFKDVILVVRRGGQTEKIRMVDAESFFERTSRRAPYVIKPGEINELIKEVQHPAPLNNGWDVSVEALAELSWDLSVRRRDQSELLAKLESLRECDVVPLGDFCEIIERPRVANQETLRCPKIGQFDSVCGY